MVRILTILCTLSASIWVVHHGPSFAFNTNSFQTIGTWLTETLALSDLSGTLATEETLQEQLPGDSPPEPVAQDLPGARITVADVEVSVSIPYFERNRTPSSSPAPLANPEQTGGSDLSIPDLDVQVPRIPIPEHPKPTLVPTPLPRVPAPIDSPPLAEELIVQPGKGVQTLLLLGSDKRAGNSTWRTDVIMVVVIDYPGKSAKIISIPRDLFIESPPEAEPNKINTFDYWGEQIRPGGGPALLSKIINDNLGIPIELYARLQFSGFVNIVDALGGIEVHVPCSVYDIKPQENIYLNLQPGDHKMDGATALAYVRTREQGGDLARVQRQQHVLLALRNKFKVRNLAPQIPGLYNTLKHAVETNIGFIDAVNLARFGYYLKFEDIDMLTLRPPAHMETGWAYGMQVWLPNWSQIRQDVQFMIDNPVSNRTEDVGVSEVSVQSSNLSWTSCQ